MGPSLPVRGVLQTPHPSLLGPARHLRTVALCLQLSGTTSVPNKFSRPEAPWRPQQLTSVSSALLGSARPVSTGLRTTAQCPGTPPPQPRRALIYILHSDWPGPGLPLIIFPDTMVVGGAHTGSSPTWLAFSVQPAEPCLGMFIDLTLFCQGR